MIRISLILFLLPAGSAALSASAQEVLRQVQQLIQQGDLAKAHTQLSDALKVFPREVGFHNLLGVVEAQKGNYEAAEASFRKAIDQAPRFVGAYLNLGRLYQENRSKDPKALQKGLETYQQLLKYQPEHLEANYQCSVLLLLQGAFHDSLRFLSKLPPEAQNRPQALAIRCAALAALGDRSGSEESASRLLSSSELTEADILAVLPVLGTQQEERNELQLRLLKGLVQRELASPSTLHQLGLLYENQGKLEQARQTLEKVAERQSVSSPLLVELARVAYKQGDREGSLSYLAHARDLDARNAGIHFFFGIVCVELDLAEDAYKSLKQAVELDSNNPFYSYALGAVALQRRDPSEGIPYFQKYCQLKPEDPRGRFALGVAYFQSSQLEQARKELLAISGLPETAAGAHYFLGRLARQENNLPEAIREMELALQAHPDYVDAHAELGLLHLRQKEYALAEKSLQRAVGIDQDHYATNLNLLNLYQRTKDPRAEAQAQRFEEIKKKRSEEAQALLRTIEVRPY